SRGKYKHLFEQAPFPIVLCDEKANILDCNYATEKIFGYRKEELIHKNYLRLPLYPSEYIPTLKERLQQSCSGIAVEPLHLKLYKEDKSVIWITSILSRVKIKGTTLFQAILLDITELREASELIQHKLEIEKVISSISSRFISNIDIDEAIDRSLIEMGSLIGAKRAFLLLNNEDRTVEFYSQVPCSNTLKPDKFDFVNLNIDDFPYILREYEKSGYVYIKNVSELPQKETDTKTHLQKMQIESLLLFPIKINEKLLGFIGFDDLNDSILWSTEDFTLLKTSSEIIGNALERKWGEETLKSTNQLLTAILCSLTECVILIDREYNIIWVNKETENLFNPQFVGKKCFEFLLNSHKPCKHCTASKTFTDGNIHESEYNFKAQNNSNVRCWCTTNVASNDKNGRSELVIIILRIIDEKNH
ncbi:MAG: PAS domain S-box protein, partial [Candidatus Lokiarchaeota archaeon]